MEGKILILPDIHCRSFWKDPLNHIEKYDKIIFLGDYLDQYPDEGFTTEEGFANLEQFVELKKQHKDKIVLLIGNHDHHYWICAGDGSRYNRRWAPQFTKLFRDNKDLFDIAWETNIDGTRYFFSHAGVLKGWLAENSELFNFKEGDNLPSAEVFNSIFKSEDEEIEIQFESALRQVGPSRWGYHRFGSMVWADVHDHNIPNDFNGVYQIFGHSQQWEYPVIKEHYACLDCRKPFVLDSNGKILDYLTGEEAEIEQFEELNN